MALSQRRSLLVGRLRRRKTRIREGSVLVEGVRAVDEALSAGARVHFAVHSPRLGRTEEGRALLGRLEAAGAELHDVSDDELEGLSDTEQGQGVLTVCAEPSVDAAAVHAGGRYLVLDAVQDPGNVGTLVRVARAFALDGVLVLDGTVDPWSPKAVRASAGMAFRVPLLPMDCVATVAALDQAGVPLLVADASGHDVGTAEAMASWALVVANEGAGPRAALQAAAAQAVRVPMPGGAESLNAAVAGAILLYALTQAPLPEDT